MNQQLLELGIFTAGFIGGALNAYGFGRGRGWKEGFDAHKGVIARVWDPEHGDYFEARRIHDEMYLQGRRLLEEAASQQTSEGEEKKR